MEAKTAVFKGKEIIGYLKAFAIIDDHGGCFMVVYGESKKDWLINYLNDGL